MSSICPTGRFNIVAVPSLKPLEVTAASGGAEHSVVLTKVFTHGYQALLFKHYILLSYSIFGCVKLYIV